MHPNVIWTSTLDAKYVLTIGPDVADVADWQRIAVEFVDGKQA